MKKQTRVRSRCVAISGERNGRTVSMRVQTVDGQNLSAETVSALLAIGAAAMKHLGLEADTEPILNRLRCRRSAKR